MNTAFDFTSGFEFAWPWALLALLLVPWLAWQLGKAGPLPSIQFPSLQPLRGLGTTPRRRAGRWRWVLPLLALALLIVALARPRLPRGDLPDPTKGIDIMLTLDFSRSMAEQDFHLDGKRISRRAALLHVVEDFVTKRPHDRIGIVCFASSPFLVSPLTLDHEWAMNSLRETDCGRSKQCPRGRWDVSSRSHRRRAATPRVAMFAGRRDGNPVPPSNGCSRA